MTDTGDEDEDSLTEADLDRIAEFAATPEEDRDPDDLVPDRDAQTTRETRESPVSGSGGDEGRRDPEGRGQHRGRTEDARDASRRQADYCSSVRRDMSDASTAREVVEEYPDLHVSEIMRHAYGECECPTDEPPTSSPVISPEECREFRGCYREGLSVGDISDEYYRADNSITRHVFGRCSHDTRPLDQSREEVGADLCRRVRESFARNDLSLREISTAVRLRPAVVRYHLAGDCPHSTGPTADPDPPDGP